MIVANKELSEPEETRPYLRHLNVLPYAFVSLWFLYVSKLEGILSRVCERIVRVQRHKHKRHREYVIDVRSWRGDVTLAARRQRSPSTPLCSSASYNSNRTAHAWSLPCVAAPVTVVRSVPSSLSSGKSSVTFCPRAPPPAPAARAGMSSPKKRALYSSASSAFGVSRTSVGGG